MNKLMQWLLRGLLRQVRGEILRSHRAGDSELAEFRKAPFSRAEEELFLRTGRLS